MQIHLAAYASGSVLRSMKHSASETDEYQKYQKRIDDQRKKYEKIYASYQKEAEEQNAQEGNPLTRRAKLQDVQKRATEALTPIADKMEVIKKELVVTESGIIRRLLIQKTEDDMNVVLKILNQHSITEMQEKQPVVSGRLGKGIIKSIDFEVEKSTYKELKKELKKVRFAMIEVFLTERS